VDPPQSWGRSELNDLRKEYREYSQRSLDKCFSYLNFYIGLLAALLAATLTGLLQVQPGDPRALLLLTGPAAAVVLARLGYQSFRVFYRRYVEAWVTEINLQAMLGTEHMGERDSIGRPTVQSQSGGWIAHGERAEVKKAIRWATDVESLVDEVTRPRCYTALRKANVSCLRRDCRAARGGLSRDCKQVAPCVRYGGRTGILGRLRQPTKRQAERRDALSQGLLQMHKRPALAPLHLLSWRADFVGTNVTPVPVRKPTAYRGRVPLKHVPHVEAEELPNT
jgi:hypothetical protein